MARALGATAPKPAFGLVHHAASQTGIPPNWTNSEVVHPASATVVADHDSRCEFVVVEEAENG
jgi:hypothetical protein